jgi:hypothetical protein
VVRHYGHGGALTRFPEQAKLFGLLAWIILPAGAGLLFAAQQVAAQRGGFALEPTLGFGRGWLGLCARFGRLETGHGAPQQQRRIQVKSV